MRTHPFPKVGIRTKVSKGRIDLKRVWKLHSSPRTYDVITIDKLSVSWSFSAGCRSSAPTPALLELDGFETQNTCRTPGWGRAPTAVTATAA